MTNQELVAWLIGAGIGLALTVLIFLVVYWLLGRY